MPARSLPVRVTARMAGSPIRYLVRAEETRSVVTTPSGTPASRNTASMASAEPGTFAACLSTATLPAIRAGAAKRKNCQ